MDNQGHLVLADFGMAKVFRHWEDAMLEEEYPEWNKKKKRGGDTFPILWPAGNPDTTSMAVGTNVYSAPEVFAHEPYSYGVDFWSMGVIIHEMITGQVSR
jgi:serine/threonine protein kinase